MTEQEWRECTDPTPMLKFLQGRASDRKLRLFAGRAAVEAAENFADGLAGPEKLRAARLACQRAGDQAAWYAAATNPAIAARNAARSAQSGVANNALLGSEPAELVAQAILLRCIFGNPFRPITFDPSCLTPNVKALAQKIYDDRTFDQLPSLANALEEASCDNREILGHLRGPGPHVMGCWVVDLVLGKE